MDLSGAHLTPEPPWPQEAGGWLSSWSLDMAALWPGSFHRGADANTERMLQGGKPRSLSLAIQPASSSWPYPPCPTPWCQLSPSLALPPRSLMTQDEGSVASLFRRAQYHQGLENWCSSREESWTVAEQDQGRWGTGGVLGGARSTWACRRIPWHGRGHGRVLHTGERPLWTWGWGPVMQVMQREGQPHHSGLAPQFGPAPSENKH